MVPSGSEIQLLFVKIPNGCCLAVVVQKERASRSNGRIYQSVHPALSNTGCSYTLGTLSAQQVIRLSRLVEWSVTFSKRRTSLTTKLHTHNMSKSSAVLPHNPPCPPEQLRDQVAQEHAQLPQRVFLLLQL